MTDRVFGLIGTLNNYPWGKQGKTSLAAQLCAKTDKNFSIDNGKQYSELWFGDYPDFPARVLETGQLLRDRLEQDKDRLIGAKTIEQFGSQLPFLPKIRSIAKALPLQIHPNKDLAAKPHEKDPNNFTDPSHKPEIAVALTKFEVFAGFKPLSEIEPLFKLPILKPFVPRDTEEWCDETLRGVTRSLLKCDAATTNGIRDVLLQTPREDLGEAGYMADLLPRLRDQYGPRDSGTLVALTCMNFMVLAPGEAIYIPADGIHAYLSGDIVECMTRSNNAGICPRADRTNIGLFTNTLTFRAHSPEDMILPSRRSDKSRSGRTVAYSPPTSEFDMLRTDLGGGESDEITPSDGPAVLIVTKGEGNMEADGKRVDLFEGSIFFIAPGVSVLWETEKGMQIHMAVA
ncbi:RmlC-like cupin domain-containing protein [Lasiosphaeria ovina]|uniref:Mannose-6-phosphate isomerase n=1 Tax=Lasiosphaeria ovina TaxID=92902 RepID=A0AAE0NBB2_9PEZI|nr:RmlC-like cupin domain-containing protein [Lasiosphaeria ovina]